MSQIVKQEGKNLVTSNLPSKQKFLEFQIGESSIALLPAEIVMEIVSLNSKQILPVPQVPTSVMGVYQWRGETLWILDLGILCGFTPLVWTQSNLLLVIQVEDKTVGLAVPQVQDIETYDFNTLKEPLDTLFNEELRSFLKGFFIGEENKLAMLFDALAIVNKTLWHGKK